MKAVLLRPRRPPERRHNRSRCSRLILVTTPLEEPGQLHVRHLTGLATLRDHARFEDAVAHLPVNAAVLPHILPAPENVAGKPMGFHEVEQAIDAVLHDDLRLADRFASPLREGERAAGAIELCFLVKIVDVKRVGMLVEEVHPRLFEDRFGLLLRHAVGSGDQAADGVELVADFLPFAQGFHGELALIRQQPGKNGRRIPVAPDDSLHDPVTQLDHGARHGPEVHAPVAWFFAYEQPVFVRAIDQVAMVGIMDLTDEVGAERLDHPHVLFHLLPGQSEALLLPHVVPRHSFQHQAPAVQQEIPAAREDLTEPCPATPAVLAVVASQARAQFIEVRLLRRP